MIMLFYFSQFIAPSHRPGHDLLLSQSCYKCHGEEAVAPIGRKTGWHPSFRML